MGTCRDSNVTYIDPSAHSTYDVPVPAAALVGDLLIAFTRAHGLTVPDDPDWIVYPVGSGATPPGRLFARRVAAGDAPSLSWTISNAFGAPPVTVIVQVVLSGYNLTADYQGRTHESIEGLSSWTWDDPGPLSTGPTISNLPATLLCVAVGDSTSDPTIGFTADAALTTVLTDTFTDGFDSVAAIVAYKDFASTGSPGPFNGSSSAIVDGNYGFYWEKGWCWDAYFFADPAPAPPTQAMAHVANERLHRVGGGVQ